MGAVFSPIGVNSTKSCESFSVRPLIVVGTGSRSKASAVTGVKSCGLPPPPPPPLTKRLAEYHFTGFSLQRAATKARSYLEMTCVFFVSHGHLPRGDETSP